MRHGVAVAVLELNGVDLSELRPVFGEIPTVEIDFAVNRLKIFLANKSVPDEDRRYLIETIHDLLNLVEDQSEDQT